MIHDHDHRYSGGFDVVFEGDGMAVISTPIGAARGELTHGAPNRRHLERVLLEWLEHYN